MHTRLDSTLTVDELTNHHGRSPNPLPPCGGGLGWGVYAKGNANGFDHAVGVAQHVVVPKAQNSITSRFEPHGPFGITSDLIGVLAAVHFDDETRGETDEVGNVGTERRLPPKAVALDLLAAQSRPEPLFDLRRIVAKFARDANRHDLTSLGDTPHPGPPPQGGRGNRTQRRLLKCSGVVLPALISASASSAQRPSCSWDRAKAASHRASSSKILSSSRMRTPRTSCTFGGSLEAALNAFSRSLFMIVKIAQSAVYFEPFPATHA